ncbi:hypothetical protein JIN85_12135 [Luteolibacter pohnpeiensis]|uniref:TraB/GumN family protein n=1 Tax=Luteolibacter pohnpeiensis TaxID=454153 RepID=A0A934S971_9BACT|nr:hypothetical protein [Luteolibacter pohnpeiensis]MBK1883171.1 hypothetical protein [Luteolibacter pohnpeiensis]
MKRSLVLAAALFSFAQASFAQPNAQEQFVRVVESPKSARLQTAVTRFEKDGVTLDLIGAIHIADEKYYEKLNEVFKSYDVVLFEMIGGENLGRQAAAKPAAVPEVAGEDADENDAEAAADDATDEEAPEIKPAPAKKAPQFNALRTIYNKAAQMLDLSSQVDVVDYTAQNFIHADMTAAEFEAKQAERGESLVSFALNSKKDQVSEPNPLRLMYGLITGKSNIMKLALIHTLGGAEDQVSGLTGENVVISDRNARCMEVLDRELGEGEKSIGIFYGAAHFPDMEQRLVDRGFHQTGQKWLTAWNVPKGRVSKPKPQAEIDSKASEKPATD